MSEVGKLLKALRERRGVSQSKLAEKAGYDHSYVSRLEGGARMPTREAVENLGSALGLGATERDALLASAGFLPRDLTNLLSSEPVIGEVLDLLKDESVPSEFRDLMRQQLEVIARQARFAASSGDFSVAA